MKQYLTQKNLPWLTLIAGGIGLLLRVWLLSSENEKGFLPWNHISAILLYLLTAAFAALLVICTRPLVQGGKYQFNFPASALGGTSALAASLAFLITAISQLQEASDRLASLSGIFGILAAGAMLFVARCRWKGLHPSSLFHTAICVWLMLCLICMYREWSSDPQLLDYCFQLLALACMMLSAYHRAAFDANFGVRHSYVLFNLAGVYFCCLSLAGPDNIIFFMGCAFWLINDLCNLTPMPKECRENNS